MPPVNDARSKATATAEYLAAQIDELNEGDRLGTKKDLAPQLGVATGTLNEAIRLLQERGLISLRSGPKGGIFVARFDQSTRLAQALSLVGQDTETVAGAFEVRRALEDLTVLDAARHCGESEAEQLRILSGKLDEKHSDQATVQSTVAALHGQIARTGTNRMLQTLYLSVLAYLTQHDARHVPNRSRAALKRFVSVHTRLVEAIATNDEPWCLELIEEHSTEGCELAWQ